MLNPPDLSRGHTPIGGLFLANPELALTSKGVRGAANAFGHPVGSVSAVGCALGNHVRSGVMVRNDQGVFRLCVPPADFLSSAERAKPTIREERPRKAKTAAQRPEGLTAGEARAHAVTIARNANAALLADRIASYILSRPGETHNEGSLKLIFTANTTILRNALVMLMESNRVRHWATGTAGTSARTVYAALPEAKPYIHRTSRHNQVLDALKKRKVMSMAEVRRVLKLDQDANYTPEQARAASEDMALDLYYLSLATLKPVGASYVLKAAS